MMTPFQQLGDTVAGRWGACNWNEDAFPRISAAALKESRLLETVEMRDVVQWFITSDAVPAQYSNPFGQPPINMYVADRFYIQVIFWLDATTTGPFILMGKVLEKKGEFELSIRALQRAVSMDPNNPTTHHLLGQAYRDMGRKEEAESELQMAEQLQSHGKN